MKLFKLFMLFGLLIFSNVINADELKQISVKEKKSRFLSLVVPAVDKVYKELNSQFLEISNNLNNPKYLEKINKLKTIYKVKTDEQLLLALKPHPKSVVIAQAAIESAWATSRFFKEANNLFGIWSFNKNHSRIAAKELRKGKTIWIKQYSNIEDSIRDYYINLGRSFAFKEFRILRMETEDPYKLVKKLDRYSEDGVKYVETLVSMIRYNKFYLYDKRS